MLDSASRRRFLRRFGVTLAAIASVQVVSGRAAFATPLSRGRDADSVDLALVNGSIATMDSQARVVEAVAIRDGRFVAVGSNDEVVPLAERAREVVDLHGQPAIPGLIDSHLHLFPVALDLPHVSLTHTRSHADVLAAIEDRVAQSADGEWVVSGITWHESQWAEGRPPDRWELDSVSPNNPVLLTRRGGLGVVNSAALAAAGIDASTPDPRGGRIRRDPSGEPTGILEDAATPLVERFAPNPPASEQPGLVKRMMAHLNSLGITGATEPGLADPQIKLYRDLGDNGELTVRMSLLYRVRSLEDAQAFVATHPPELFGDEMVSLEGLKIRIDGGIEAARMLQPYQIVAERQTDPSFRGAWEAPPGGPEELVQIFDLAAEHGWQMQTHTSGDEATRVTVDAYEQVNRTRPVAPLRWVVMHMFLPHPEDLATMRRIGVSTTSQDFQVLYGSHMARYWGQERAARTTPMRTVLDSGLVAGGGTDAPVNPIDPFLTMWWMTTRDTFASGTMGAEQAITPLEALRAYTTSSAFIQKREALQGSIEVGKLADLVLLSDDLLAMPRAGIKDVRPTQTILGGRVVYDATAA